MGKYRKKPVVIDAIQWTGTNMLEVYSFMHGAPPLDSFAVRNRWAEFCNLQENKEWYVKTLEDGVAGEVKHVASVGDWIIKGVQGEFYPCKPDIFDATYEPASAPQSPVAAIVPPHCSGVSFVFDPGVLRVGKDGSGYITIAEEDFVLEDDRCEGPDGPEGSVHWIARLDASEITALRDFLNGTTAPAPQTWGEKQSEDCVLSIGSSLVCAYGTLGCVNHHAPIMEWADEKKLTVEQAWTILCETPDVTSPEEYPDHALITMEQLGSFMARAQIAIPEGWKLAQKEPKKESLTRAAQADYENRIRSALVSFDEKE